MKSEPYLRKKGNKFIIEQKVDGKTKYIMTLPHLQTIIQTFYGEASSFYEGIESKKDSKASQKTKRPAIQEEKEKNVSEKFVEEELGELSKKTLQDALRSTLKETIPPVTQEQKENVE